MDYGAGTPGIRSGPGSEWLFWFAYCPFFLGIRIFGQKRQKEKKKPLPGISLEQDQTHWL